MDEKLSTLRQKALYCEKLLSKIQHQLGKLPESGESNFEMDMTKRELQLMRAELKELKEGQLYLRKAFECQPLFKNSGTFEIKNSFYRAKDDLELNVTRRSDEPKVRDLRKKLLLANLKLLELKNKKASASESSN